jgi:hypothetical protein
VTGSSNFSDVEWSILTRLPKAVALAVMAAEAGGPDQVKAERLALDQALQESTSDRERPLVRRVADEIQPLDDFIPQRLEFAPLLIDALDLSGQAAALLLVKAPAEDSKAYRQWLLTLGQHVAGAAKEGGLFGIGAARVTEKEKAVLTVLGIALGVDR